MQMISKKNLNDVEMDTLTKSCRRVTVITADGEKQTHEEATVYVKEMDVILTLKVLENSPAVLSLGKLCDENGYSLRVDQRSKTTSHSKQDSDTMYHGELRSDLGSRLVNEFFLWFSSFIFKDTFKSGE